MDVEFWFMIDWVFFAHIMSIFKWLLQNEVGMIVFLLEKSVSCLNSFLSKCPHSLNRSFSKYWKWNLDRFSGGYLWISLVCHILLSSREDFLSSIFWVLRFISLCKIFSLLLKNLKTILEYQILRIMIILINISTVYFSHHRYKH